MAQTPDKKPATNKAAQSKPAKATAKPKVKPKPGADIRPD